MNRVIMLMFVLLMGSTSFAQELKPQLCWYGEDTSFIVTVHPEGDVSSVSYLTPQGNELQYQVAPVVKEERGSLIYIFKDPESRQSIKIRLSPDGKTSGVFTDKRGKSRRFSCEEDRVVGPYPGSTISN